MKSLILRNLKHSGMALVCIGVILLIVGHLAGITGNYVLLIALSAVVGGVILHVRILKKGMSEKSEHSNTAEDTTDGRNIK